MPASPFALFANNIDHVRSPGLQSGVCPRPDGASPRCLGLQAEVPPNASRSTRTLVRFPPNPIAHHALTFYDPLHNRNRLTNREGPT